MELRAIHENCSGCCTCRLACAIENHRQVRPALAVLRIEGRFPSPGDYRIHLCDQCGECAEICQEEAILLHDNCVYLINEAQCTQCMACVDVCPYGVISVPDSDKTPIKCTACGACAESCPRGAIVMVG
jgi:Fe-S-cluster-containing hydrogenase component 2